METPTPIVRTERLTLRPHRRDDFEPCAAMWADARVTEFIGGKPSTLRETWMRIINYRGLWSLLGYGYWAIEETATGRFIGDVGFADFKREIEPSIAGVPEMGWVLAPHAHSKGYATEASLAALAWADANLDVSRIACIIAPENAPSIGVARKCGFTEIARTTYAGNPTVMYERRPSALSRSSVVDESS